MSLLSRSSELHQSRVTTRSPILQSRATVAFATGSCPELTPHSSTHTQNIHKPRPDSWQVLSHIVWQSSKGKMKIMDHVLNLLTIRTRQQKPRRELTSPSLTDSPTLYVLSTHPTVPSLQQPYAPAPLSWQQENPKHLKSHPNLTRQRPPPCLH